MVSAAQPVTEHFTAEDDRLARSVERFLFAEADLLDRWQLHDWLELFPAEGTYLVPSTDKPEGDPNRDLFLIQDDRFLLEHRVNSLLTRSAHAEYPHSRTRRLVSNVIASARENGMVDVVANFAVFRVRNGITDTYFGQYRHLLEPSEAGSFRFLVRKSILDLDALRPLGKISIIL